jgi:hypothetical protein
LGAGTDNGVYRYPFNVKSGTVASGERPWGPGLVIVNGDVTVPVGVTLNIAPGTEVRFIYNFDRVGGGTPQRSAIKVYGALNADGEPSSPIVFKSSHPSAPAAGHWQGIEVYNTGTVTMDYCVVEHAVRGVYGYSSTTQPANVQITHCRFLNHTSAGIDLDRPSSQQMHIEYCYFSNSPYGLRIRRDEWVVTPACQVNYDTFYQCINGIVYYGASNIGYTKRPSISGNVLEYVSYPATGYGITAGTYSGAYLASPEISSNFISGFYGGMQLTNVNANCRLYTNDIQDNDIYGIYLIKGGSALMEGSIGYLPNVIRRNGTGIHCDRYSSPVVREAVIKDNERWGVYIESHDHMTSFPDFGTEHDLGGNALSTEHPSPGYLDMEYRGGESIISAQGNWWGEEEPKPDQIRGLIDYRNYLKEDPFPGYAKREAGLANVPKQIELGQNYPNPFNPATEIAFSLPEPGYVSLKIYNIAGQLVRTLASGSYQAGEHFVVWDGRNGENEGVASGVYFYVLSTDRGRVTKSMTLLR